MHQQDCLQPVSLQLNHAKLCPYVSARRFQGRPLKSGNGKSASLLNYFNTQFKPQDVELPPRILTRVIADWSRDQLQAAGVRVLTVNDAITMARGRRMTKKVVDVDNK
jgi:hypothetical protein